MPTVSPSRTEATSTFSPEPDSRIFCSVTAVSIVLAAQRVDFVLALFGQLGHQRAGLAPSQHQNPHANTSGSTWEKNVRCRRETTSGTASSSITKLMLISDAPWEIMWMLASGMALKTLAAIPGVLLMFSPTRQTIALRPEYFTSASLARSAAIAAIDSFESTVTETLTSEVETMSTGQRCWANTSKMLFKKPWAMSMRVATTSTTVMRFLAAMALNRLLVLGAVAVMRVPSHLGLREFRISTGIFFWMAGSSVAGCSTLAPK